MSNGSGLSLRNRFLQRLFRAYPFDKGRYRLMKLMENMLDRKECVSDLCGQYRFLLDLSKRDLESTFYYFMPEQYEAGTQRYLRQTLKPGMTTIDIGAHIGLYALLLAQCVGPTGKVYSFEPDLENFSRLKKNIELNQLHQVIPFQVALSDATGSSYLTHNEHSTGHALKREPETGGQVVQTVTLDDFIEKQRLGKIELIKIDAEGSEDLVLAGGRRLLSGNGVSEIICEIHSSHNTSKVGQDRVRKIFYSYGFRSYVLDPSLSRKAYLAELLPDEPVKGLQNLLFKKI